jgi:hypothetical protein
MAMSIRVCRELSEFRYVALQMLSESRMSYGSLMPCDRNTEVVAG